MLRCSQRAFGSASVRQADGCGCCGILGVVGIYHLCARAVRYDRHSAPASKSQQLLSLYWKASHRHCTPSETRTRFQGTRNGTPSGAVSGPHEEVRESLHIISGRGRPLSDRITHPCRYTSAFLVDKTSRNDERFLIDGHVSSGQQPSPRSSYISLRGIVNIHAACLVILMELLVLLGGQSLDWDVVRTSAHSSCPCAPSA